jgi:hypothetical protein
MIRDAVPTNSTAIADESRTLTFAELKELIEQGKTDQIPNNRPIPEAINVSCIFMLVCIPSFIYSLPQDAAPSESTAPTRKKPWEIPTG